MNKVHSHYDNLRVTQNAPSSVIKAAYKTLCQQYHPDKSLDPNAERIMTILNASYQALSDPERRSQHDAWIARQEEKAARAAPRAVNENGDAPAQASARTAEPVREAQARERELQLPETIYFWPLVFQALRQVSWRIWAVVTIIAVLVWWPFKLSPTTSVAASAGFSEASRRKVDEFLAAEPQVAPAKVTVQVSVPAAPQVSPLARAPNGEEWPSAAGYVPGYALDATGGYSTLTIDNTSNDYNVYVKLAWANAGPGAALRHVFIPRHHTFTMEDILPGAYEIKYRNLSSGSVAKTEAFALNEEETGSGVRYSQVTFTLYTVQHGNTKMQYLSADQF
jgi:hypothetical protein